METTSRTAAGISGAQLERAKDVATRLKAAIHLNIVGKDDIIRSVLEAVVSRGHVLVEGVPGIAKTLLVKSLSGALGLGFSRIQFTPDLLPSDLTGTPVYDPRTLTFSTRKGPLFANVILADEVNRAPAKVQSALLEAMEERQITLGDSTLPLPDPFFVFATQNPVEHEGTYPLPEAELDRFFYKLVLDYPDEEEEFCVVSKSDSLSSPKGGAVVTREDLEFVQHAAELVTVDPDIVRYAVRITRATRPASGSEVSRVHPSIAELHSYLEFGASPRAAITLFRASRARALMDGRGYVLPDDVKGVALQALRHRIVPNYEAEANDLGPDDLIARLLLLVKVP